MKSRKGAGVLESLGALGVGVAVLTIVLIIAFLVAAQANTQIQSMDGVNASGMNASGDQISHAYNASRTMTSAVATIPTWVPLD